MGFLSLVQYVFWVLVIVASLCLIYSLHDKNVENAVLSSLLLPAAIVAALAAHSHRGLAEQAHAMARKNQEYASMTRSLKEQLGGMGDVRARLDELGGMQGDQMEHMSKMVERMEYVTTVSKVITVLRGFTDAESQNAYCGIPVDKKLSGVDEIAPFVQNIEPMLASSLDHSEMGDLKRILLRSGVMLSDIAVLTGVVSTQSKEEARTLMALLKFLLNPGSEDGRNEAVSLVSRHMQGDDKFGSEAKVRAEVSRLHDKAEDGRIPPQYSQDFLTAVLDKFHPMEEEL